MLNPDSEARLTGSRPVKALRPRHGSVHDSHEDRERALEAESELEGHFFSIEFGLSSESGCWPGKPRRKLVTVFRVKSPPAAPLKADLVVGATRLVKEGVDVWQALAAAPLERLPGRRRRDRVASKGPGRRVLVVVADAPCPGIQLPRGDHRRSVTRLRVLNPASESS